MMTSTARGALVVLLALSALSAATWRSMAAETEAEALAAVLASDAPHMDKLRACKRLAEIGGRESVAALAPLLAVERLSHPARIALEAIPDEAAGEALRAALPLVKGLPRIGVISSLGVRRDAAAVGDLGDLLRDADPATASAAAAAMGRIGTAEAAEVLNGHLRAAPSALGMAIGDALLTIAENRAAEGKTEQAIELFDGVRSAELPEHLRLAAVRGAIQSGAPNALDRFLELLHGDEAAFAMALEVGRSMPAAEVAPVVAAALAECAPHRQVLLVTFLGDLDDAATLPVVVEQATSAYRPVRVASLAALATLGDVSALPLLLEAAADEDEQIATAARRSLTVIGDQRIDAQIAKRLIEAGEQTEPAQRLLLIELAGRRRIEQAVPALLSAADAPEAPVRLAAVGALGQTLNPAQLPALTERLLDPQTPEEFAAVQAALRAACVRTAEREAAAAQLVACLPRASADVKHFLFDLLGAVGGEAALMAVAEAALEAEFQDTATRVLGEWMTPDAAPALLAVVRQSAEQRFRVRALRGYLRIVRQFDVSDDQRVAMCSRALELAERNEERVLALEALGRTATRAALDLARTQLALDGLADQAAAAAVAIGEQIAAAEPRAVAETMAAVLKATNSPEIVDRAARLARQAAP